MYNTDFNIKYFRMYVGLIESPKMTHDTSLLLARLEDELRRQLGVVYPQDA